MSDTLRRVGNKTRLTQAQADLIRLIDRSDSDADGWRKVSAVLWPHVKAHAVADLVELDETETGGRIRFTERGAAVRDYL
jgi:hypothetical protein